MLILPRRYLTDSDVRPNANNMARPAYLRFRSTPHARRAWQRSAFKFSAKFLHELGEHAAATRLEARAKAMEGTLPRADSSFDDDEDTVVVETPFGSTAA